jgi:hypothetical protein
LVIVTWVVLVGTANISAAACGAPFGVIVTIQPVVAAGIVITPELAVPPVPTFIWNAAVPLDLGIVGVVPNPLAIVGAVADISNTLFNDSDVIMFAVVNLPVAAVVAPTEVLFIVDAAVGLIVKAPAGLIATVPVPDGEIVTATFAGDNVTVLDAVRVVAETVPPVKLVAVVAVVAVRLATAVVLATTKGAVPVTSVEVICPV